MIGAKRPSRQVSVPAKPGAGGYMTKSGGIRAVLEGLVGPSLSVPCLTPLLTRGFLPCVVLSLVA